MFEGVLALWREYIEANAPSWEDVDPRHDLSSEVRTRLIQLDIILGFLRDAIDRALPNREETQKSLEHWMSETLPAYQAGRLSDEEYKARMMLDSMCSLPELLASSQGLR